MITVEYLESLRPHLLLVYKLKPVTIDPAWVDHNFKDWIETGAINPKRLIFLSFGINPESEKELIDCFLHKFQVIDKNIKFKHVRELISSLGLNFNYY